MSFFKFVKAPSSKKNSLPPASSSKNCSSCTDAKKAVSVKDKVAILRKLGEQKLDKNITKLRASSFLHAIALGKSVSEAVSFQQAQVDHVKATAAAKKGSKHTLVVDGKLKAVNGVEVSIPEAPKLASRVPLTPKVAIENYKKAKVDHTVLPKDLAIALDEMSGSCSCGHHH